MSERELIQPTGSAILRIKELTGIPKANCWTCACGRAEIDGEPGATYHCGIECSKSTSENSYIEDDGIDPDTEKACWEPEYWASASDSPASKHADAVAPIDANGSTESMIRNMEAWQQFLYSQNTEVRDASPHATNNSEG